MRNRGIDRDGRNERERGRQKGHQSMHFKQALVIICEFLFICLLETSRVLKWFAFITKGNSLNILSVCLSLALFQYIPSNQIAWFWQNNTVTETERDCDGSMAWASAIMHLAIKGNQLGGVHRKTGHECTSWPEGPACQCCSAGPFFWLTAPLFMVTAIILVQPVRLPCSKAGHRQNNIDWSYCFNHRDCCWGFKLNGLPVVDWVGWMIGLGDERSRNSDSRGIEREKRVKIVRGSWWQQWISQEFLC